MNWGIKIKDNVMPKVSRLEEVVIEIDIVNARQRFRNLGRLLHSEHEHYLLRETSTKSRKRVVINDYEGSWYNEIEVPPIIVNGQLAYAAQKRSEKWVLNFGGNEGPEHVGIRRHSAPKHIDLFLRPDIYLHLSRGDLEKYRETLQAQNPALGFLGGKTVYVAVDESGLQQVRTYDGNKFHGDANPKFTSVYHMQEFKGKIAYFGERKEGGLVKTVLVVGLDEIASIDKGEYFSLSPFLLDVGRIPAFVVSNTRQEKSMVFGNEKSEWYYNIKNPQNIGNKLAFVGIKTSSLRQCVNYDWKEIAEHANISHLTGIDGLPVFVAADNNRKTRVIIPGVYEGPLIVSVVSSNGSWIEEFRGQPLYLANVLITSGNSTVSKIVQRAVFGGNITNYTTIQDLKKAY